MKRDIRDYMNKPKTKKNEEETKSTSSSSQKRDVRDYINKSSLRPNTLQSDLTSLTTQITNAYNGWQTKETMQNTLSSVKNMYSRLGKYQEYSGADFTEVRNILKSTIDGWDGLSREYSKTKNADEYNKMVQSAKEILAEDEKAKTDDLGKVKTEIDELEKIYNDVKKYDDDVKKLLPNGATRASNDPNKLARLIKEAETKRDDYAKSIGYESYEALENLLGKKKNYYNRAQWIQKGINLASPSAEDKDFEKKSQYVQPEEKYGIQSVDNDEDRYKYINDEVFRDAYISSIESSGEAAMASVGYEYMTDEEKKQYNYYYNSGDKKKAREYLKTITESLGARKSVADYESYKGNTAKELLFGVNAGLDQFAQGIKNVFNSNDEYIPVNATQQLSGMIRDDLNYEHGNWGKVPYDFITTTSNMLPSILTSTVIGKVNPGLGAKVGTALMGASAGGNAYQEMVNLGYDPKQARAYALLVGVSESSLQSMMGGIGKLGGVGGNFSTAIKSIDNAFARFAINYGRSMVAEGIEEATQEVLNPIFKNLAAGYDTGEKIDWGEVVYSGLLGAMSGGFWEGRPAISNARAEVHTGKNIKTNERVSDMFDLANNPEIAEAYETYTRYAKKGITADNVTDAQLGRLYNEVKSDAVEKMNSKNSTDEQRASGMQTLGKLALMKTENTIAKEKNKLNVGEETKVTETGEAVDIKALKVKGEDVVLNTEKGEVSTDKITLADTDADIVAHAKVIARTDGENIANLFLSQYNGETNIDEYANSFNLTVAYAKNDFRFNQILENKGNLSTDQVNTIYAEARKIAVAENEKAIAELNKKMADGKFYKGIIDESVINYGEEDVEGKVKWTSLTSRQRQAVTFIKGFAQATGMNVAFVANNPKYNGKYDKETNTITINLDEGGFDAIKNIEETIIPTMSHETTHWMKNKSPELWENLNNIVFSTLTEHYNSNKDLKLKKALVEVIDGKTYTDEELKSRTVTKDDLIDAEYYRLAAKAKKDGKKVDAAKLYDTAKEEIIARACEDILSMSEQGRKIFKSLSESEQKTLVDKIKAIINDLLNWVDNLLNSYKATSKEAQIMREYKEELQKAREVWDKMLEKSIVTNQSLEKSGAFKHDVDSIGTRDLTDLSKAVDTEGNELFQYKAMEEDKETYRTMLLKHRKAIGISTNQITDLFDMIDKAVDIISENLEALDYAWDVDIDDRAFSPIKNNSDKLYKVSLDFSTLCRKRLLQQTVQATLQETLNKQLSKEEGIAIRDELIKIQEEGRKIEVACALCYVESARMKSPVQINKFLNNRENVIKEFFANRSGGSIKEKIKNAEMKARESLKKANPKGLVGKNGVVLDALTAPKSKMLKADADFVRAEGKKAKASYKLTEHEQAELDAALNMSVSDFTSAKGLENLAKNHSDIFDAYTSFVRNATHSKGIENDVWWRAGDSDAIGDNLIEQMNKENGLRSQSWSDFQVIHLLDYIAATIELSTKVAKRQSYTKVPDYVKLLGNTGDMINMSVIPERVFEGKLAYDDVEGMAYKIACELREQYHETAGIICIGIDDTQIRMLLEDGTIDMVIPYHSSSMSKDTRKLMHIPSWKDYQAYQNESSKLSEEEAKARAKEYGVELKKDENYQKSPDFSDWFNLEEARQIAKMENNNPSDMKAYKKYGKMYGGYMAMQNAANNYLKLCAERGLAPKFSHKNADYTHEANYWKLLIDRKMVDNVTGEIIEQKAIKPIFNEKSVLEILNDELERYPQVKADQEYASRKVTEKFLSGEMKVDKSTLDAIKKPIDNIAEVNILESSKDNEVLYSGKDDMEVIDIPFGMYSEMEEYFGTTKNYEVAGYLLRDGKMLDFSGKHWSGKNVPRGVVWDSRQVDHRDIQEVLNDDHNGVQAMMSMISNGNIRLMPEVGGINLSQMPNAFQHDVLRGYINHFKGEVIVDIDAYGGDTIHSFEYSKGTSASKILSDLDGYFHRGELPSRTKSELADFLYSEKGYDFGISQNDINLYVDKSYRNDNTEDYIKYSKPSQRLLNDISKDFDISEYTHALRDNDIRHIRNSHGEKTNEKYPVTRTDIMSIPYIVENYDKVLYKTNARGQGGLVYIKVTPENVVYYVEAITMEYHNEKLLVNKQMVKTGIDEIPNLHGLIDAINKKQSSTQYLADLKKIREAYAQSAKEYYSTDSISNSAENVKEMFSEKEQSIFDTMGEADRIKKENERFKAEIERLKERQAIEKKVTNGKVLNDNHILNAAGHLRNISKSNIDKVTLAKKLKELYTFINQAENLTWEEVYEKSYHIADAMLKEATPEKVIDDYSKHILREIKNQRISLSEAQKKEAQYIFGKNWNRNFFGRVIITDGAISLERQWQEWANEYPDIFNADITDTDMPGELYDIIGTLQDASETIAEYDMAERTRWLANEVYNQYWNISNITTTADKYDKRIKLLNAEHRRNMNEIRTDYATRLQDQKIADDIYYGGKLGEQQRKYESKIAEKNAQIERQKELYKKLRERKEEQIALAKEHGKERLDKYKDNAQRKTYIQRITANALTLNKWLKTNSKDYHIHEAMKGPVIKLLNAIDLSSKQLLEKGIPTMNDISFNEAFSEVKSMLENATNMVEGFEELYGHDLAESIDLLSKAAFNLVGDNNYVINAMNSEQLMHLDKLVRHIKKVVTDLNKFHVLNHNKGAINLANEFMEHGAKLGNIKNQHGKWGKFFEFRNRTPYYFFKTLGEVGEKLFTAFQDGWDKLAFNAKRVIDYAEEIYTAKEVNEWSKETKSFTLEQIDGNRTIEMSIAQIMALHCVSKQADAQRHLLSGGMTLKRIDKKGHVVADYENITLSPSDLTDILSSLTDRQKEVADKLQEFMNTVCAEWGNEISMARFGIEQFGIPDYFPIKVSEATVPTDNTKDIDNASLFRLLNMSFTKARNDNAEQSIEIGDIFDVFAQHSSDMAKYNALALPVLDFNKFYSIQGKDMANKEFGVVKTLKSVFGDEANTYLRRFVRDINGSQNVSRDVIGNTFFKNAKLASVAANLRVVLLQPTAFFKASAILDNKYLLKASAYIKLEPIGMVKKLKKAIANAEKYCGIVQWKSLGYYDTDISKGLTEKIKHAETIKDKAIEKSLLGAEIADKVTFGTLWVACEFEIRDTRKDLKVGSEEFYKAIATRLREVIYATQVVDSTMTRSDMMRSPDKMDKMYTTFGSEPIIAYNMLLDCVSQIKNDTKEFGLKNAITKNTKKARKVVAAYVITNIMAALVESGFDAFRDDDDEEMSIEEFMKLYFKNFAFDMSIGNKLPYIKEAYSIMQGYSSSRMDTQWMQYLYSAITTHKPTKAIKDVLRLFSQVTGLPFYNVYRDAMATLNKLDLFTTEDLNEMFEDFLD